MSDEFEGFSLGHLGRYLRDEETPEEKAKREQFEAEQAKRDEEMAEEQMRKKREGYTYGADDASLEKQAPKPRELTPEEMQPPKPRKLGE